MLVKKEDGAYKTTVYRKLTHTDRYTHFTSHHHPRVKSATIECLARKDQKICDNGNRGKEIAHIRSTFMKNEYPRIVQHNRLLHQTPPLRNKHLHRKQDNTTNRPPCLFLPYVQGL